jgi:hypothetical protein
VIEYEVTDITADGGLTRLYFATSGSAPSISSGDIGYINLGLDGQETAITFESILLSETVVINQIEIILYYYLVSGDTSGLSVGDNIQVKSASLRSNFQLTSVNSGGDSLFYYKFEKQQKNIRFSSDSIYVVVGMKDYAKINGIVVEELRETENYTFSPSWITSSSSVDPQDTPINYLVNSGGSSNSFTPSNFVDAGTSSLLRYDSQTTQPVRPGNTIYSTYADQNIVNKINMNNIFGSDRKTISGGLRNNKAYVFTASRISLSGDMSLGITMREQ